MKQGWHHITDVRGFLNQRGRTVRGPHAFTKRILHWPYCARCGLVLLKNDVSRREAGKICVTEE